MSLRSRSHRIDFLGGSLSYGRNPREMRIRSSCGCPERFFQSLMALLIVASASGAEKILSEAETRFFLEKIQPVLERNCFECHSAQANKVKGGLLMDSAAGMRRGG